MPGLMQALTNLVRGKKRELAKRLADPIRDGHLAIEDSQKMIANFTTKVAQLVAQNKSSQRELTEADAEVTKYQRFAEKAVSANSVDDARRALELKAGAQRRMDTLKSEIARNDQLIAQLRDQLAKARTKVANAKRNIVNLEARNEGAKIRTELAKATSEFNAGDNPLAALDDLEKEVTAKEAEAEAWEELTQEGQGDQALEEKYSEGSADIDSELAQLMAKMKNQ